MKGETQTGRERKVVSGDEVRKSLAQTGFREGYIAARAGALDLPCVRPHGEQEAYEAGRYIVAFARLHSLELPRWRGDVRAPDAICDLVLDLAAREGPAVFFAGIEAQG